MLETQITLLHSQAKKCFKLADLSSKTREFLALSERGEHLLAEARTILKEEQEQSTLYYFEFMLHLKKEFSFETYLEFTYRNGIKTLCEEDYNSLACSVRRQ